MDQIVYISYCGHSVVTMDNHQRWKINIFEHFCPECYHQVFVNRTSSGSLIHDLWSLDPAHDPNITWRNSQRIYLYFLCNMYS